MDVPKESDIYKRLKTLGFELPPAPPGLETFCLVRPMGNDLLYLSGLGPDIPGQKEIKGKLGTDVDIEEGQLAARCTILNALSVLHNYLGDLNRITGFIKLLVLVASDPSFYFQPQVANGASELLLGVFGDTIGKSSRSAIGVAVLPQNIPVEIEMIIQYTSSGG